MCSQHHWTPHRKTHRAALLISEYRSDIKFGYLEYYLILQKNKMIKKN